MKYKNTNISARSKTFYTRIKTKHVVVVPQSQSQKLLAEA
jgi:hypothetical protein